MNISKEILWENCLSKIKLEIPTESYETWFIPIYPHSLSEETLQIIIPNNFYKECLQQNYYQLIKSILNTLVSNPLNIEFIVEPEKPEQKYVDPFFDNNTHDKKITSSEPTFNTINSRYTFSNFVVGSSNQFAHAAANAVANNSNLTYNPLFLYGGVGLGKTHLLHSIGNAILEKKPQARIRYLSAESFTVDLIESLKKDDMPAFRNRYRPLDILFVDDIQFLAGKERTQEEFFYTFNTLYESHKQIILSSDKYPKEMLRIEERLRSRFESGLIADIETPDLETKVAIIHKKAEQHNKVISHDVAMFIADKIKTNIRELEGVLLRVVAFASFTGREINLSLTQEVLKEFVHDKNKNFTVSTIMKTVAGYFEIKVSDLKSKNRSRQISIPRQISMYLCREYTKLSLPDIGRQFGGKDHTTVIFAHKKMTKVMKEKEELEKTIKKLVDVIESGKPL
jgi:chromosomal replication initiator protein